MKTRQKKLAPEYIFIIMMCVILVMAVVGYGLRYYPLNALSGDFDKKTQEYAAAAADTPKGGIVFFGDSITEMYDFDRYFPEYGIINRGISGDYTEHLLSRVQSSVIDIAPSVVFFLAGANDIGRGIPLNDTLANYSAILDAITTALPDCQIVMQSVYPVNAMDSLLSQFAVGKRTNAKITEMNARLATLSVEKGCTYIDMYPSLVKDDVLNPEYTIEGLHLNTKGYDVVSNILSPYLESFAV